MIRPEWLHDWYLEATKELNPESYNEEAQKPYEELTEEQKKIDKYIADKINGRIKDTLMVCRLPDKIYVKFNDYDYAKKELGMSKQEVDTHNYVQGIREDEWKDAMDFEKIWIENCFN